VDIFYPSAGIVFSKDGVFQQPRLVTSTIHHLAAWLSTVVDYFRVARKPVTIAEVKGDAQILLADWH
jgi:hypothetical protein